MTKMNRALSLPGYFAGLCVLLGLVGFVESSKSDALCNGLEIEFRNVDSIQLVGEDVIQEMIASIGGDPIGRPMRSIDFNRLEAALKDIPHLEHVAIYSTVDQFVNVEVRQRSPLIRIIDKNGINALMDRNGFLMPLSDEAVLRLPVFTGNFGITKKAVESNLHVGDSLAGESLQTAFELGSLIYSDDLWRAQFQHLSMEKNGDVVAFPQVGNHTIILGKDRLEEKLEMLRFFYRKGMTADSWNQYESINLKYKDQIVCTKK